MSTSQIGDGRVHGDADFLRSVITFVVPGREAPVADSVELATGDGRCALPMPVRGHVVAIALSMGAAGAAGKTDIVLHNETQVADLLAAALSVAAGGDAHASTTTIQNANFNRDDVLSIDVDDVATGAENITVFVTVVFGKHTTDYENPSHTRL